MVWMPPGSKIIAEPPYLPMTFKMGKALLTRIQSGYTVLYVPESDLPGSNLPGSKIASINIQVPYTFQMTIDQQKKIEDLVASFVTPVAESPDLIASIDNVPTDERNKYAGTWSHMSSRSLSYTLVSGSTLTTTFDGYKFEWWTEKRLNHGFAAIQIDGGVEIKIDLYEKTTDMGIKKVYESPILSNGQHTIVLKMAGEKNPVWETDYPVGDPLRSQAGQDNIIHDRFVIYKKQ